MEIWAHVPQSDITESLEWMTDIQRCPSAEYRQSLRKEPRQELHCTYHMTPAQFGQAKMQARALGASSFFVPLWPWFFAPGSLAQGDTMVLKDTSDPYPLTMEGTSILIWESASKYEVHTVSANSVNPANPYLTLDQPVGQSFSYPVVVPLRVGEFAQEFEATRSSFQCVETKARLRILLGDDYSPFFSGSYYRGHAIANTRSLAGSGVSEQFERRFEEIDSHLGGAYRLPLLSSAEQSGQITWSAKTRTEMRFLAYWLHSRKGKWKSFWAPSWNGDLTLTHEVQATDTTIEVADTGIRTWGRFPCDIMIETKVGGRIYRKVNSVAAGATGKAILSLDSVVGSHLYTWDVVGISMLVLSRFDSDRIELNHGPGGHITATAQICEVPV